MTPAQSIRARAEAMLRPGHEVQVCTDATSTPGQVLVGIARPDRRLVMTIPAAEYEAAGGYLAFAAAVGLPLLVPSAMERARMNR